MSPNTTFESYRAARDLLVAQRTDWAAASAQFQWPELGERFNWAVDWFDAIARSNDRPALIVAGSDGSRTVRSFDEMASRSDQVAAWLRGLGVVRGDVVMVMLGNQVELWEAMLGIFKLGAIVLPTTTAVGAEDLKDRVARGRVRYVIANGADTAKFAAVPGDYGRICVGGGADRGAGWRDYAEAFVAPAVPTPHPGTAPGDPLLHYFTSGTTTRPKLVEHTQSSYPVGHLSTMYWLGLRPGDVHLAISSPGWAKHAWSCFFAPWIAEATIFVYDYPRFDAGEMLATLRREQVTSFCAPPTVWRMLIQADLSRGPGSLREAISAGEPLNPEVINTVRSAWGLTIRDGYGQTEMTAVVSNSPGSPVRDGSMGRPSPGCPVVLVDPVTGLVGDDGEICLDLSRPHPMLMTGYLGDPERTAEAMAGGFYHTGDVATRDADGYITYVGRTDDVFKASDFKISPFELESALIEHPAVVEAAIVPAPDELRLAVPKAYVVLAAGYEPNEAIALEILGFARTRLSPFQRIRRIEFFDLPKTISGKIRRVELREREEQLAAGRVIAVEWRDDSLRD
ncbi:MAG TPA: AMP-binding protein [Pseudolysinimonas sp.]|nr:AMP-binding protein [Pseudolysinimonas sp.]